MQKSPRIVPGAESAGLVSPSIYTIRAHKTYLTSGLDGILSLPDHSDDRATSHVLDKRREEGLLGEISVMCLKEGLGCDELGESGELEALCLETLDDFSDESSLDAVWLNHDVSSMGNKRSLQDDTFPF